MNLKRNIVITINNIFCLRLLIVFFVIFANKTFSKLNFNIKKFQIKFLKLKNKKSKINKQIYHDLI